MALDAYSQYQQNQILTATPAKLLLAAYDGTIRFCRIAGEKMKENKYEEQNTYINKALAVVSELIATLREDIDPLLVSRLKSLYLYIIEKLTNANFHQDQDQLNEAIKILSELRATWAEAEKLIIQQNSQEEAA